MSHVLRTRLLDIVDGVPARESNRNAASKTLPPVKQGSHACLCRVVLAIKASVLSVLSTQCHWAVPPAPCWPLEGEINAIYCFRYLPNLCSFCRSLRESTFSSTKDQRARITKSKAGAQPASVFSTLGLYPLAVPPQRKVGNDCMGR